jgi:integrase
LNQKEIQAILAQLEPEARLMVMLAVTAGLWRSELFGLQWGDVNFLEMQISIQRSIYLGTTGK